VDGRFWPFWANSEDGGLRGAREVLGGWMSQDGVEAMGSRTWTKYEIDPRRATRRIVDSRLYGEG
jgi:hypothetical protein